MSRSRKIAYSAGSLGTALSYQAFSTYIQYFYIDILGLAPALFGLAWTVYGIWNAINDPLAGHLSDRTRTRWGRRIPYIAGLTLPLALCFVFLWIPPFRVTTPVAQQTPAEPLFIYFLLAVLVFDTLWTFVVLNWTALFPEMYPDEKERAEVSGWRQLFSILGLIVGIALPPMIYGALGWGPMAVIFAVITAASLLVSVLGSREEKAFSQEEPLGLLDALKATFGNRSFRYFLLTNLFIQFTFLMLTSTVPFYAEYVLCIGEMETSLLLGAAFVVAVPCLYLWTRVAQRYGARQALLLACGVFIIALIPFLFANNFITGVAATSFLGVGLAGLLMLTDLLVADVVDEDELITGRRREGMFFGINGFIIRFAYSMQGIIAGIVLSISGYSKDLTVQPPSAVSGIRFLIAVVPILALLIALYGAWRYPLHGQRLAEVKAAVERLHARKIGSRGEASLFDISR